MAQKLTGEARKAWYMYAAELRKALSPADLKTFREDLLKNAKDIASLSGGLLGAFFTVDSSEKLVLKKITDALGG